MGYAKGKRNVTESVWLAMFGSLYVTSDKKQEEDKETKRVYRRSSEPSPSFGVPLMFLWSIVSKLRHSVILQPVPGLLLALLWPASKHTREYGWSMAAHGKVRERLLDD